MQQFIASYGYLAVFLLMAAESACVPIPSELIMLLAGALSAGAVHGAQPNLPLIIAAGALGNTAGSYAAWTLGRYGGQPACRRWGRYLLLREGALDRAQRWFDRYGPAAVFVGRLLPVVRTFISLPAGIAGMGALRFGVYTLAGCIPFTAALGIAGYALGDRWQALTGRLHGVSTLVVVALVLVLLAAVAVALRRRSGWPSTRMLAVAAGGLQLVVLCWGLLCATAPIGPAEAGLDRSVATLRSPAASAVAVVLTDSAQAAVGMAALAAGVLLLWLRRRRFEAARLLGTAGAAWALVLVLKALIGRARPPASLWLIPPDSGESYPSGHATTAAVIALVLTAVFTGFPRLRRAGLALGALFTLAVGASRVYLGDHYPSDVLASYLTVLAAALAIAAVARTLRIGGLTARLTRTAHRHPVRPVDDTATGRCRNPAPHDPAVPSATTRS